MAVHLEHKPISKSLQHHVAKQEFRIRNDEMFAERAYESRQQDLAMMRSNWMEQLDGIAREKRIQKEDRFCKEEYKLAKEALLRIRRKELNDLLDAEHADYQRQLAESGYAIHTIQL